jgi:hypothetical protein
MSLAILRKNNRSRLGRKLGVSFSRFWRHLFGQGPDQVSGKQVADSGPVDAAAQAPVRVVGGTPFVPNVNPRER